MKTRYFRRKENCAAVEWIEMSGAEYLNFVRNPKNKDRFFLNMKNVVLECSKEEYLQNRAEKRRSDYLAEGKKDWTIISLFAQRDKESCPRLGNRCGRRNYTYHHTTKAAGGFDGTPKGGCSVAHGPVSANATTHLACL